MGSHHRSTQHFGQEVGGFDLAKTSRRRLEAEIQVLPDCSPCVGVSHEMMNSRERRLSSWSNATCAMPLCEALSSRRGRGPHHAQIDLTGLTQLNIEMEAKRVQLDRLRCSSIQPAPPIARSQRKSAARVLGVRLLILNASSQSDIEAAFRSGRGRDHVAREPRRFAATRNDVE
jgi:hypothetical protein